MQAIFAHSTRRNLLAAAIGIFAVAAFGLAHQAAAQIDPSVKTVGGISAYLGVMPAAIVRGHPSAHPEVTMHGGVPSGRFERHVVVALFDAKTFVRITNADIEATVEGLGHTGSVTKKLERMDIADAPTFGGYFPFQGPDKYTVRLKINAHGYARSVIIEFTYDV
jgi:hypothetical protein